MRVVTDGAHNKRLSGQSSPLFSHQVLSDSATPWTATRQASLSFTIFHSLLKLMFIESMLPSNHLILCCPLLFLPSIFPSIRICSSESTLCIRGPKFWSFSSSVNSSKEYSGWISFRIEWFGLPTVQETLKSFFQHHNLKATILQCSALFMVQLSHLCMTIGKNIALIIHMFVCQRSDVSAFQYVV